MSTQKHCAIMPNGKRLTMISMEEIPQSEAKAIIENKFFTKVTMESSRDESTKPAAK